MAAAMRVLVTGAGSGIGRACAERLAAHGAQVLAGARKTADLDTLGRIEGVTPLRLDMTVPDDAAAAAAAVAAQGGTLDGLVHNAGIGELGLLPTWTDADVRHLFETNLFGVLRLTRALMPALLAARGRIVHVGSQGGSITQPFYGPYTMSKHALEAMSECLRQELAPHGVAVSIVQPGAVATSIGERSAPGTLARLEAAQPPFDAASRALAQAMRAAAAQPAAEPDERDEPESATHRKPCAPDVVAAVIEQALTVQAPQARYLVGTRWEGDRVLNALIERLLDAAGSPSHRLTRDELVAMIDAQRARRAPAR
ncbi:MAG: SDR family oxidoreductase [Rubrivivax sp.]|nr:SDR family oxidoreductase [Rubrivivax sp.]